MIKGAFTRFLGILYPAFCGNCGHELGPGERFFCTGCAGSAELLSSPYCTSCGRPFVSRATADHLCHECMRKHPPYDFARAQTIYKGVVKEAIHLYKYRPVRSLKGYLGDFIEEGSTKWFKDADLAVAVPLHKMRLRQRGFNQSLFLAQRASKALGIGLSVDGLARVKNTRPQVDLDRGEREANVRGAFKAARPLEFEGRKVLLVDDVYTTGATVKECARVLRAAGADKVCVLTVARVFSDSTEGP